LAEGQESEAQDSFLRAARLVWNVEAPIQMAAIMASAGEYEYALALLDEAEADHSDAPPGMRERLRQASVDYESEMRRIREQIRLDMSERDSGRSAQ
jgi:hypothetical protein